MIWLMSVTLVGGGAIVAAREGLRRLPAWRETIQAALEAAVALRPPLPRYPRAPRHRSWEIVRAGSAGWRLIETDGAWATTLSTHRTRKAVQARLEMLREQHEIACREWVRDINPLTVSGHGTAWRWEDDPEEMG